MGKTAGKIVKPQKSKRHRKMKAIDPFYHGDRKALLDRNASKVNRRPKNDTDQEIPYALREMMTAQKSEIKKKQKQKKNAPPVMERGMTRPVKPIPVFQKRAHENEAAFMNRVNQETQAVIKMSQFADKFKLDADTITSAEDCVKRKGMSERKKERLQVKKSAKKKQKQNKVDNRMTGFEQLKDEVSFGEVVMQPPNLTSKPRKAPDRNTNKPGGRSLLLKQILCDNATRTPQRDVSQRPVGVTQRRRDMSLSQRHRMDAERERVVELYRQMKAKKQSA